VTVDVDAGAVALSSAPTLPLHAMSAQTQTTATSQLARA
jgi:hypothetical protein